MDTEWGREIPVAGVRPVWLADDVTVSMTLSDGERWDKASDWSFDGSISHFRLPADHFAYAALDAGFEPWGGGDAAPGDWDGGEVLFRCGKTEPGRGLNWKHTPAEGRYDETHDIIGYRKRVEPATATTDIWSRVADHLRRCSLERVNRPNALHTELLALVAELRLIGAIPQETPLERFEAANPGVVNTANRAAVEAALAWERGL